jgi:hypothetical protein
MTISALSGPVVTFGQSTYPGQEYNPDLGPSLFYAGVAILDPRQPFTYTPGQDFGQPVAGFLGTDSPTTIFATPATITATAIAAAAAVTANTAMTLVSSSSATTGVATGLAIVNSNTGASVAGVLALDAYTSVSGYICNGTSGTAGNLLFVTTNGNLPITIGMVLNSSNSGFTSCVVTGYGPATGTTAAGKSFTGVYTVSGAAQAQGTSGSPITITGTQGVTTLNGNSVSNCRTPFGQSNSVQLWNPQALVARAVSITPTSGAPTASITFAVSGYDIYGYPMTENILLTTGSTQSTAVPGLKAFKYIASILPSVTDTVTYSVGTTNVIGLPFRSDTFADVLINYSASLNPVQITSATGYTAAVLTPATGTGAGTGVQTTGDVRGTYTLQTTAATAANRLVIKQAPLLYNTGSSAGLFGNTQA